MSTHCIVTLTSHTDQWSLWLNRGISLASIAVVAYLAFWIIRVRRSA